MPFEVRGVGVHNPDLIKIEGLKPDMQQDDQLIFGDYYELLHDVGIAPNGNPGPDYLKVKGAVLKAEDFDPNETARKEKIERLLRLGAIRAVQAPADALPKAGSPVKEPVKAK